MIALIVFNIAQSATPDASQSPELVGPVEAFKRFIEGISATEAGWIIVAVILVGILYWFSIQQLRRTSTTSNTVLWWIAALCGWFFLMYIFGWVRISAGAPLAALLALASALLAFVAVLILKNRKADWQKIVSGTIIIIIGFTIASTIAIGARAISYGLFFGCTFGMILGMLIITVQRMNKGNDVASQGDEWSNDRPKEL